MLFGFCFNIYIYMYIYIFLIIDFFNSRFEFVRYPRLAREGAYRTNSREIRAMQVITKKFGTATIRGDTG